jgi:hypothetical protein
MNTGNRCPYLLLPFPYLTQVAPYRGKQYPPDPKAA